MCRKSFGYSLCVSLFFLVCSSSFSEENGAWICGVARFEGRNLSPEYTYLTRSIPLELCISLQQLPVRTLSAEEAHARAIQTHEELLSERREKLSQLLDRRDELFFSRDENEAERAELDRQIEEMNESIDRLAEEVPSAPSLPLKLPVQLSETNRSGFLLEIGSLPAQKALDAFHLDLLFTGLVEEVEGFFYVELYATERMHSSDLPVYRKGFSIGNLSLVAEELNRAAVRAALGRDFSSLRIVASPLSATIFVDGERRGSGEVSIPYIESGSHEILIRADRHEDRYEVVDLEPGEFRTVEATLVPSFGNMLALTTYPEGADVYVSSEWRGKSPLFISDPLEGDLIRIQKDGYQPVIISPFENQDVRITLTPERADSRELVAKKRTTFYRAFGLFALSVPLPVFSYGLSSDYAQAYSRTIGPDKDRLYSISMGMYSAYLGGLFISGSLFIDMAVKLIDYIRTAENAR